jgi:hypothetical protein
MLFNIIATLTSPQTQKKKKKKKREKKGGYVLFVLLPELATLTPPSPPNQWSISSSLS